MVFQVLHWADLKLWSLSLYLCTQHSSPHPRWNSGYRLESLCLFWLCDVHAILTSLVIITGKGSSEPWAWALPPFWYHTFQMRSAFMFLKQSQNESRIKSLLKRKKRKKEELVVKKRHTSFFRWSDLDVFFIFYRITRERPWIIISTVSCLTTELCPPVSEWWLNLIVKNL